MRVASFFPFQATYYLNGHSFIEQELKRAQIGFRKTDNAFLAVDDVAALQAAADKLSPADHPQTARLLDLDPGAEVLRKERKQLNLSRFYSIAQIEYCRNFIFKRNFPIHKLFERSCEFGLWRLTANKISDIFGVRLTAESAASSPPSSNRSSTAIMSSVLTGSTPSSNSTRNSPASFATSCGSNNLRLRSKNAWTTSTPCGKNSGHHRPLRRLSGTVAQRERRLSPASADRPPITIGSVRYPGIKIHHT